MTLGFSDGRTKAFVIKKRHDGEGGGGESKSCPIGRPHKGLKFMSFCIITKQHSKI